MRLLLTGATGVAGSANYRAALADPAVTHITLLSRRPVPSWAALRPNASAKTTTIIHGDFVAYSPDVARRLSQNDACIWALGKTSVGMSKAEYTEMTHGYVMSVLRALKEAGVGEGRSEFDPFRFVYISGEGADPSGKSFVLFSRVKGKTETDLTEFCTSSPGMRARIYRPGYFFPSPKYPEDRRHQRPAYAGLMDTYVKMPLYNVLAPSLLTPIDDLARFSVELAKGSWPEENLFRNKDMRELSKHT